MVVESRSSETQELQPQRSEKPWWNRPLIGDKSLLERIKAFLFRKSVGPEAIDFHDTTFKKIDNLSMRMASLDWEKFGQKEFLAFVRISRMLEQGEENYANLMMPMALLRAGLTAHQSFTSLEQIEFTHRGLKFNEFYNFVNDLCFKRVQPEVFARQTKAKSAEMFNLFKTREGREALRRYTMHLSKIGQDQLSLNLLYAFKRLQLRSYTIFRIVSDILKKLKRSDLLDSDILSTQIIQNYDSFEKLGDLIGLRPEQQNIQTYTLVFQYLAMTERHARAYEQFQSLTAQFKLWRDLAQKLSQIRQQYPASEYRVPKQFSSKIPGSRLYEKYSQYFQD